MGNTNTKESRYPDGSSDGQRRTGFGDTMGRSFASNSSALARNQIGTRERSFLGLGAGSSSRNRDQQEAPFEHRETKAEREARKLERERVTRDKDRERSLREEHVDGGYLVTLGTYTGTEDFSKPVVRQLQIERKLAPFWRGLNEWSDNWAEHQLIAAACGFSVPAADALPDPNLVPRPLLPESPSSQNINSLTVEMRPRTLSTSSDRSGSATGSGLPSPAITGPAKGSIKPRARAIAAALSMGSRNASSTDLVPKEITLPHDPFVNGQPIEVFLYKDATECPICFLTYPPYLNHTRCCDQPICSECFVQIKRADPHLPERHPDGQARDPNEGLTPEDPPEMLISEPSACPYCQQPEFGVTYEPPPFRRGLLFSSSSSNLASSTAMSSQSSIHSTLSPSSPNLVGRRRTHSLSANAPNVITIDRVRPDWATKLASARAHQARRAAAATALHTAAFLMGGNEPRSRLRTGRFGRRNTGTDSAGTSTPGGAPSGGMTQGSEPGERESGGNPPDGSRRTRMEELEDMMFMEAVRLSLAAEEERKTKTEKALRKEAEKQEKAERKALKKQGKGPYAGSLSGTSGSSLSLGLGRKRGSSAASSFRLDPTAQASRRPEHEAKYEDVGGKGKGVDRGPQEEAAGSHSTVSLPIPTLSSRGGSHLRQMSNASSLGSSLADSPTGSYAGQGLAGSDGAKHLDIGSSSDNGDRDMGSEPMFNFRSLAELVGVNIDDGSTTGRQVIEPTNGSSGSPAGPLFRVKEDEKEESEAEHVEETASQQTTGTRNKKPSSRSNEEIVQGHLTSPEVTITPGTPVPGDDGSEDKRLGASTATKN